jgi:cholesterol transport system auxiliary component
MRNAMTPTLRLLIAFAASAVLAACASHDKAQDTMFDLGSGMPRTTTHPGAPLPAVVITDATGSAALESEKMYYRLNYADAMQARAYANSRWSTNPLEMVTQRLKTRLSQTGAKVLEPTDAAVNVPILRVQVDDFMQTFANASQSTGVVVVRASVFRGHALVDQQTFTRSTPAQSADASGGARALATSLDGIADDIAGWLARQNLASR